MEGEGKTVDKEWLATDGEQAGQANVFRIQKKTPGRRWIEFGSCAFISTP
jgi:hypothetical protein